MVAALNGRPTAAVVALACAVALLLSPSVPTLYRLRIGTVLQCTNWREADLLRYPLLVLACAVYAALAAKGKNALCVAVCGCGFSLVATA